jgi:K+-transporting ATPase KdpF subunit
VDWTTWLALLMAVAVGGYLVIALLKPEWYS